MNIPEYASETTYAGSPSGRLWVARLGIARMLDLRLFGWRLHVALWRG